ncbi:hypothetical protein B0J13DRAFT_298187 [Dactylonectria estremocensis]|uniref:Uncharacterized protein n=1 Tax=Dactylonectria estremocensis TaxID=1079267 RepID=A0A9P9J8A1_9HYPO|nr:hypothetical protein B0J13DRAFT_298187 [Dactylonectria estremocensis]
MVFKPHGEGWLRHGASKGENWRDNSRDYSSFEEEKKPREVLGTAVRHLPNENPPGYRGCRIVYPLPVLCLVLSCLFALQLKGTSSPLTHEGSSVEPGEKTPGWGRVRPALTSDTAMRLYYIGMIWGEERCCWCVLRRTPWLTFHLALQREYLEGGFV